MPGSGKSTFGRVLARELNFVFIDLDYLVEKEERRLIKEIFSEDGEGKFRELETKYLQQALDNIEGFVLSTGGGTPCFNDNMDSINEKAVSVFLDVPVESLHRRLTKDSASQRPLFLGMSAGEITLKLKDLLAVRGAYYDQAKIKLNGDDPSIELLISELMTLIKS